MRRAIQTVAFASAYLLGAAGARGQAPVGDFYYFERVDAETGSDRSTITTLATENRVSGAGGLTWGCREGQLHVTVTSTYLGRGMRTQVRWRFDDEEMSDAQEWILRSSGMAVTAPGAVTADFTARARRASRVEVFVTDFQFLRHRYTFSLRGLEEAISNLACGPSP